MTSLAGEFQTDLTPEDAVVACADAIDGLGWEIETVEFDRIVSHANGGSAEPALIEVDLSAADQGTEIRIIGSDDGRPISQEALIAHLESARDAIQASMEQASLIEKPPASTASANEESPSRSAPSLLPPPPPANAGPPPGWFRNPDGPGERWWDGTRWTDHLQGESLAVTNQVADSVDAGPPPKRPRGGLRRATQIISLVLLLVLGVQSCAVAAGGSLQEDLSTNQADKQDGSDLAGAGAMGIFAALLWLVAAAFVMSRPKVAMWLYLVSALFCLIGANAGFSDLWFWMFVSLIFALMSWRGISEVQHAEEERRAQYRSDVQQATEAALVAQAGRSGTTETYTQR